MHTAMQPSCVAGEPGEDVRLSELIGASKVAQLYGADDTAVKRAARP